jgi:hypothetical protein
MRGVHRWSECGAGETAAASGVYLVRVTSEGESQAFRTA